MPKTSAISQRTLFQWHTSENVLLLTVLTKQNHSLSEIKIDYWLKLSYGIIRIVVKLSREDAAAADMQLFVVWLQWPGLHPRPVLHPARRRGACAHTSLLPPRGVPQLHWGHEPCDEYREPLHGVLPQGLLRHEGHRDPRGTRVCVRVEVHRDGESDQETQQTHEGMCLVSTGYVVFLVKSLKY